MEDSQNYYGAPSQNENNNLTIGDRLRELYDPSDFVVVKNIDSRPITYQFVGPNDIETFSAYAGHKDTVMHKPPKRFTLQPGETKLCPAHEADMMITNLIKQITVRKVTDRVAAGEVKDGQSISWDEPNTREQLIDQIYLGKKDLTSVYDETPPQSQVEDDLNIEETRNAGRPRKTA